MTTKERKELQARYVPKFKRELSEGITSKAIFAMVTQMHRVGQLNEEQANTVADCVWIAKSELREEGNTMMRYNTQCASQEK